MAAYRSVFRRWPRPECITQARDGARPVPALRCAVLLFLAFTSSATAAIEAIPTFHSIGLYWSESGGSPDIACDVRFRKAGAAEWRSGYPLWCDARAITSARANRPANEYRGSLVHLDAGTTYEIELSLRGTTTTATVQVSTWNENFPIAKTITLPARSDQTLVITESGSPSGYVLYAPAAGENAAIDVAGARDFNVQIRASHVIVRGLTLAHGGRDAVRIEDGSHDVVIENCDIHGWGRLDTDAGSLGPGSALWGMYGDAGIYSSSRTLTRVIIQRNRIHHPRTDSNHWDELRTKYNSAHPRGPIGIYIIDSAGHHVVRYNEITSDNDHRLNDIVSGDANFSHTGFPNRDSDIYGNLLSHAWDDAIEAEGGNCNVRIWGNYLTHTYTGIATAATSIGPLYIFRNVYDVSHRNDGANDAAEHGPFGKLGDNGGFGGGRRYFFHNTLLQQPAPPGSSRGQGAEGGLSGGSTERPMIETWSRNNIWHLHRTDRTSYFSQHPGTRDNHLDADLHSGGISLTGPRNVIGPRMIRGTPSYAAGHGPGSHDTGRYALAPGSFGFDAAEVLPNFNDGYVGGGPDIGAHEAGTAPMQFGVDAHLGARPPPAIVNGAARLSNLSVRGNAGTGPNTLIVGFSLAGTGTKPLLVRGIGPTLAAFGVSDALPDPTLRLDVFHGAMVAQNDDWTGAAPLTAAASAVGAFALPASSKDAALLAPLSGGTYTAQIGGGAGIALVEVYDAAIDAEPRLTNVSTRTQVGAGGDILIAGFTLAGTRPRSLLIRAIGPALGPLGVTGALANPRLALHRLDGVLLAENDDWGRALNALEIRAAAANFGAFPIGIGTLDAALLAELAPGGYTVQISGTGGTTGVALVEIYEGP